ncbi:MAG: transposase [Deltaproteobacteria bacterium]|nr:transposase [Deltaproteobacteria bacterium]
MGLRNRWNNSGYPYFVTTTVVEHLNVFKNETHFNILCKSLAFCKIKFTCKLLAYCLMPNHIHLVLWPDRKTAISDFMRDFKKYTSVHIRKLLELQGEIIFLQKLRINAQGKKDQIFKLWQSRFDDLVLTDIKTLLTKINYIHENPVRKGLVSKAEDWFYSSASNYTADKPSAISIDKDWQ